MRSLPLRQISSERAHLAPFSEGRSKTSDDRSLKILRSIGESDFTEESEGCGVRRRDVAVKVAFSSLGGAANDVPHEGFADTPSSRRGMDPQTEQPATVESGASQEGTHLAPGDEAIADRGDAVFAFAPDCLV